MFQLLVVVITAIANFSIALVLVKKNRTSASHRLIAGLSVIIGLWTIFNYLALLPGPEAQRLFWVQAVMFVTTPFGTIIYLLSKAFPGKDFNISRRQAWFFIIFNVITALSAPITFTKLENLPNNSFSITPGFGIVLFGIAFVGFMMAGFIQLSRNYKKSKGVIRKQFQFFIFGTVTAFTLLTLTNFVAVVIFKTIGLTSLGPPFTLIMVGAMTYAIAKHRFLDISNLVARTVSFTLLTSFMGLLYAGLLLALPELLPLHFQQLGLVIAALSLAYTFPVIRKQLSRATDRIFHTSDYDQAALLEELGDIIRSTLSLEDITNKVVQKLKDTLQPTQLSFYLVHERAIHQLNYGFDESHRLTHDETMILAKKAGKSLLLFEEVSSSGLRNLMRDKSVSMVIPLRTSNSLHGLLVLGEKASGEIYNSQDLRVLEIFGPQISIAIQNSLAYDEIKRFNLTLSQKIKDATKDLRKANRELRHLDRLKDEFVYVATHELKTPVTVMRGYISMINDGQYGPLNGDLKTALGEIDLANQQLVKLVNDLLEIARNEVKSINIQTQPTDLCSLVDETVNNIKPLAEQKNLTIDYACPTQHLTVKADPDRLKEILNNLLSNAIKYSEKGVIKVSHVVEGNQAITHIKDQGVGISQEDQKKIFTRFFRAEEQAGKVPGTGLGSFIVKQLVEKMGGRIWFTSDLGKGTTFSFSLPKS